MWKKKNVSLPLPQIASVNPHGLTDNTWEGDIETYQEDQDRERKGKTDEDKLESAENECEGEDRDGRGKSS